MWIEKQRASWKVWCAEAVKGPVVTWRSFKIYADARESDVKQCNAILLNKCHRSDNAYFATELPVMAKNVSRLERV